MSAKWKSNIGYQSLPSTLSEVRSFLLDPNETGLPPGAPLWHQSLKESQWDALQEWIDSSFSLNERTTDGKGWLHCCIEYDAPVNLAVLGMRQLNREWADRDERGITPLHLPCPLPLAQAMAMRWWSERRNWKELEWPLSPEQAAAQAGRNDLEKMWKVWRSTP